MAEYTPIGSRLLLVLRLRCSRYRDEVTLARRLTPARREACATSDQCGSVVAPVLAFALDADELSRRKRLTARASRPLCASRPIYRPPTRILADSTASCSRRRFTAMEQQDCRSLQLPARTNPLMHSLLSCVARVQPRPTAFERPAFSSSETSASSGRGCGARSRTCRSSVSIRSRMSGLSFKNCLEFSRPCPMRSPP